MGDFEPGRVTANGITFEYLEAGEGPLALCMHGFPDTPFSYRHMLPVLAELHDGRAAQRNQRARHRLAKTHR